MLKCYETASEKDQLNNVFMPGAREVSTRLATADELRSALRASIAILVEEPESLVLKPLPVCVA
jgi:hypothetical protein